MKENDYTKKKKNRSHRKNATFDSPLLEDLHNAKRDIDTILYHLNYYTDPDLIDSYTYQLKAAYLRYKFILHQIQDEQSA